MKQLLRFSFPLPLLAGLLAALFLVPWGCSTQAPHSSPVGLRIHVRFPRVPAGDATAIRSMRALAYREAAGESELVAEDSAPVSPGDSTFSLEIFVPPGSYRIDVQALDAAGFPLYSGSNHVGPIGTGGEIQVRIQLVYARPRIPENLTASSFDHEDIVLGWRDPSPENTLVHRMERAQGDTPDTSWAFLDSLLSTGDDSLNYTDHAVPTRRPYLYRVRGENQNGVSSWSAAVLGILYLGAPESLSAVPVETQRVDLQWAYKGPDPNGFRLTRINHTAGESPASSGKETINLEGTVRAYSDTGLLRGTSYEYALQALGFNGAVSPSSDTISVVTGDIDPQCTVTTDLDFGQVNLGGSMERTVQITNTGGKILTGFVQIDECLYFSLTEGGGTFTLGFGDSHTAVVAFAPIQPGDYQCALSLGTACGSLAAVGNGVGTQLCGVSTPTLDFGETNVDDSVVLPLSVTNTGSGNLDLIVSIDEPCRGFSIFSGAGEFTLPPGITHPVEIRFSPISPGLEECVLDFGPQACRSVELTGSGIGPICSISDTLHFGELFQDVPATRTFSISNTGGGILEGSTTLDCSGFSLTQGGGAYSVPAGTSHQVTVQFQSTIIGSHDCSISTGSDCPAVVAQAHVISAVVCDVSPMEYDFGEVEELESKELDVIVTNTGGGRLSGVAMLDCPAFSISGDATISAASGQSDTISVVFSPPTAGLFQCTLDLGTTCSSTSLTGIGTPAPLCEVTLLTPDSGSVDVGDSLDYGFVIRNTGGGFLTGAVALQDCGEFELLTQPAYNVAQGDSAEFAVRFSPSISGPQSCTVLTGCGLIPLTGTGNDFQACMVEPDSIDFGIVLFNQGNTTVEDTFTVTNTGTVLISGNINKSCGQFELGPGAGPFSLLPGDTKEMVVIYHPQEIAKHSCTILTGLPCGDVFVTGKATIEAICLVSNSTMDFGLVGMGKTRQETFTIFNTGGGALEGTIAFGDSDPEFSLISGQGGYFLQGGEQHQVVIEFAPATDGTPGVKSFSIPLSDNCPAVSGTARSSFCQINPSPGNFGSRFIGSETDKDFTLRNISAVAFSGAIIDTACSPFSLVSGDSTGALPYDLPQEGDAIVFTVRFKPTAGGDFTCALDLGGPCGTVELNGSAPACFITPNTLDFIATVGETQIKGVTIWNTGGGVLALTPALTCDPGLDAPAVSSGGDSVSLLGGQSHTVLISYAPTDSLSHYSCSLDLGPVCSPISISASSSTFPGLQVTPD